MEKISVLISAFNKHDITRVHVRECLNSTRVPDEIIVVNDGGTPDLIDKLKDLLAPEPDQLVMIPDEEKSKSDWEGIAKLEDWNKRKEKTKIIYARIIQDIPWNYTGARNLGMFISTGDFISLEDNDHIPDRNYYQDCLDAFKEHPEYKRLKTHKRYVVAEEDVLTKPFEEWTVISKRPPHQDVAFNRREVFLQLKGYDERFAGEYGWCSTDLNRRINRAEIVSGNAGYQYVVYSPKTRGLSSRNWRLSRTQRDNQSPIGILNFQYTYEQLS